jgi:phosphohistidine swiveling domain-containing protein
VYAVELAGRPWLNLSLWFRWLDYIGMPRTMALVSLGGETGTAADARVFPGRLLRALPRLLLGNWRGLKKILDARRALRKVDREITTASGLLGLHGAMVSAWVLGLHTALAIAGVRSLVAGLRQALRIPGGARPMTQDMMEEYAQLAAIRDPAAREAGLDAWLKRYGHRGPLESDLARPRFAELREVLLQDLASTAADAKGAASPTPSLGRRLFGWLFRPFFWLDERREWFRDAMMRQWQRVRLRLLEEGRRRVAAGEIDAAEDVFWLHGDDLRSGRPLRESVTARRRYTEAIRLIELPLTSTADDLERRLAGAASQERQRLEAAGGHVFAGISLGAAVVEGRALKADDLTTLLTDVARNGQKLGSDAILVVPSLEPSWAVIFPRVGGVVAEVGGEMSHASILLREARRPAVVNCAGIFTRVRNGDHLRLDGVRGMVEILPATPTDG